MGLRHCGRVTILRPGLWREEASTLLTRSVVSEELPPPHPICPYCTALRPSGTTRGHSAVPKEMQTGCVCVIVVPTMGFNISPGKSFQKELSDLAVFPQVSRRPYQGDREGRQTQWNTPPGGAAPLLPNFTAPFPVISNRPDGKHYALCSTAFCSEGKISFSQTETSLGLSN